MTKRAHSKVDRISALPGNLIENILFRLPLRDAVRTSILSHFWRYGWNTLPHLVFDEDFVLSCGNGQSMTDGKRAQIVDQVLLLHRGPIRKFKLSFYLRSSTCIDRWICFISRNGIKEFILKRSLHTVLYKVPSCFYFCEGITHLELVRCSIKLPTRFKGFTCLTTLALEHVACSQNELEVLVSVCPRLTKLVLKYLHGPNHYHLSAAKLVELEFAVTEAVDSFVLEDTPLLAILSIDGIFDEDQFVSVEAFYKLIQSLKPLTRLKELNLHGWAIWVLSSRPSVPWQLPAWQLEYLSIELCFELEAEVLIAISILKGSPNLEKLHIKIVPTTEVGIPICKLCQLQEGVDCLSNRLRIVELTKFTGTECELQFIKFVLANALVLETVRIQLTKEVDDEIDMLKKITRFRRVSPKAEIVFLES